MTLGTPQEAAQKAAMLSIEMMLGGYSEEGSQQQLEDAAAVERAASASQPGATDVPAAFREHFAYLVDSPGYEPVLAEIAKHATATRSDGENFVVEFDRPGTELIAEPAARKAAYKGWPASFRALVARHANLWFPDEGCALCLGESGNIDFEVAGLPTVREVMRDFADWWVVGTGKNTSGRPAIARLSHESCGLNATTDLNPGALFLKRVAEELGLTHSLPSVSPGGSTGQPLAAQPQETRLPAPAGERDAWYSAVEGAPNWLVIFKGLDLALFETARSGIPQLLGRCALPSPVKGSFKLQVVGSKLYLGDTRGYVEIDVRTPEEPRVLRSMRTDACRAAHWFGEDEVVFHYYLNSSSGIPKTPVRIGNGATEKEAAAFPQDDGYFRQPLGGSPSSIVRLGDFADYGHDTLQVGETTLFVSQESLEAYEPRSRRIVIGDRLGATWPKLVELVPRTLAAVIDVDRRRQNFALRLLDPRKNPPEGGAMRFQRTEPKAWCLAGDRFWLVLAREEKRALQYCLGALRLPKGTEEPLLPLPANLPWADLVWIKVADRTLSALFKDGVVRRLPISAGATRKAKAKRPDRWRADFDRD